MSFEPSEDESKFTRTKNSDNQLEAAPANAEDPTAHTVERTGGQDPHHEPTSVPWTRESDAAKARAIAAKLVANEVDRFEILVNTLHGCYPFLSIQDCQDVVQESFVDVFRYIQNRLMGKGFDQTSPIGALVFRFAWRRAYRGKGRRRPQQVADKFDIPDPKHFVSEQAESVRQRREESTVSRRQYAVFQGLRCFLGPIKSSDARVRRACKLLCDNEEGTVRSVKDLAQKLSKQIDENPARCRKLLHTVLASLVVMSAYVKFLQCSRTGQKLNVSALARRIAIERNWRRADVDTAIRKIHAQMRSIGTSFANGDAEHDA